MIKKINNNVAECIDERGNHLIAFGKGIGFPSMPYTLTDLGTISMTFYKISAHFEKLLIEIPEEILNLSSDIIQMAQKELQGKLNPTLVFSLADHIQFSVERLTTLKNVDLTYSYEIAQLYPKETKVAEKALLMIQEELAIYFPKGELTSLTMHFVNSQMEYKASQEELLFEQFIERVVTIIEEELKININKDEFNYNRFYMHIYYYIKRISGENESAPLNQQIIETMRREYTQIYHVSQKISQLVTDFYSIVPQENEIVYLMMHINRLYEKNKEKTNEN